MTLPAVGGRFFLTTEISRELEHSYTVDSDETVDQDIGEILTDVTVLARDLDEGVWTVWDHGEACLKLVSFDENKNWRWIEPEIEDDEDD